MPTALLPEGRQRYYNNDGTPAAGGKLHTYAAGTTNPKATYADEAGQVANPNPITLDAKGEALIYWSGAYKVDLKQADGLQVTGYPVDNLKTDPAGIWGVLSAFLQTSGAGAIGWVRGSAGAVATTVAKWLGWQAPSVFDFMTDAQIADARSGVPVLDHTAAVQKALDTLPRVLEFNPEGTFRVGVLKIKAACEIRGNGCGLLGSGLGIFNAVAAMPFLAIHGFKNVAWTAGDGVGVTGRQFFWNGNNAAGATAYGAAVQYPINDLRIYENNLGASKIECFGLATVARIERNNWVHGAGVNVAPAYLYLERGTTDDNAGPVYVDGNHFDVHAPSGYGKSIIKVSGGISDAHITNNYVFNRNMLCLAHVDVFTGAHKMRFTGNTLIDVQLHRKQVKGSLLVAPQLYQMDLISGNSFDIRAGAVTNTCLYFIGALGTITHNQFRNRNATELGYAIQLDASDVDIGFATNGTVANIIAGNIFDMRASFAGNAAIKVPNGTIGANVSRLLVVNGNLVLGGSYLLQGGGQAYSSIFGNVWGSSSTALGVSMNGTSPNNLMLGNVADSAAPVLTGNTRGNLVNAPIPTLPAGATPDVSGADMFLTNEATITDFTGGYIGKKITLFTGGATTVVHGGNIQLSGGQNCVFDTFIDSLTLVQTTPTRWVEIGRSGDFVVPEEPAGP